MCIIAGKKIGIPMPDSATLQRCFENNSDGAGIMWAENGAVHIRKGFMNYDTFNDYIDKLGNRINLTDTALVMHFRITTHGATNPQTCHPFPISKKIKDLKRTSFTTDIGVAHNGIIRIKCIPKLSDTQSYIVKRLYSIYKRDSAFFKDTATMNVIEKEIQSKMCFLTSEGELYTIGNFIEEDGVLYSNSSYEDYDLFSWYKYLKLPKSKITVCPVYGMVIGNGDIAESDGFEYFIDDKEKVYEYDYISDCLVPLDNAQAFSYQGTNYRFSNTDAIIMNVQKGMYL